MKKSIKYNIVSSNLNSYKILLDEESQTWSIPEIEIHITESIQINLKKDVFKENQFEDIEDIIGAKEFDNILELCQFVRSKLMSNIFKNRDRLTVYFDIIESNVKIEYLVIIAMGEFQPARYMTVLEGIWEVQKLGYEIRE